jgi:hypothetical protein
LTNKCNLEVHIIAKYDKVILISLLKIEWYVDRERLWGLETVLKYFYILDVQLKEVYTAISYL